MSESNQAIPSASHKTEANSEVLSEPVLSSAFETCGDKSWINLEGDKSEKEKPNTSVSGTGSKIARPTGLKLPGATGVTTSRIARLCNNVSKPTLPPNLSSTPNTITHLPDYGSGHRSTYSKSTYDVQFENNQKSSYTKTFRYTFSDRVSLRDIGIRQPLVHFDMDCKYYGSGTGSGKEVVKSFRGTMSEEFIHKRFTDLNEADESRNLSFTEGKWTHERKMSSGSVLGESSRRSTPDDQRNLRSSGASYSPESFSDYWRYDDDPIRSSDASIVLTENTDQFIIGDRVWVGGVKPGQIAYIGETQFAPGEWAGIVLDEPIGKNDGTVANIRYFQCEPKKGIFSRLTRLTKLPLLDGGAGEPAATRPVPVEPKRSNGTLSSPVPKKSPLVMTPTSGIKNSISKPSSPDSGVHSSPSLAVGDRVIIQSSQGSKAGILRFIGTTDFAAGEWCGVELDDPLGKNDGSVSGTRYFECRPKFGLFAPVHKVSKSPANKRLFQPCMVHPGRTSLRRQGSKESLVSMSSAASAATSVRSTMSARKTAVKIPTPTSASARTTLQDALKKKEAQLEQLLKQRDLERAEVTRAASQADEAERQLACMKNEFEKFKKTADSHISELDAAVCLLKAEKDELITQLDDEKKKYEDLQFRFEEETIDKADMWSTVAQYEEKLNQLEKTLSEERKRGEALEHESNKLFEAEEQMVIVKDELDTVKEELETHKKVRSTLEQEHISIEAHLTSARAEIESLKIENQSLKAAASKDENVLKANIASTVQKLEETRKELEKKEAFAQKLSEEVEAKNRQLTEKAQELEAKRETLMNKVLEKHKVEIKVLTEELNSSWEMKLKVLQYQLEEKIKEGKTLEEKLNDASISLSKNNAEKVAECRKQQELKAKLQSDLKQFAEELELKTSQLTDETAKSHKFSKEIEALKQELVQVKNALTESSESNTKKTEELNAVIGQLKSDLLNVKAELQSKAVEMKSLREAEDVAKRQFEENLSKLYGDLEEKESEIRKLKEEFENKFKEVNNLHQDHEEALKSRIKQLEDSEVEKTSEIERLNKDLVAFRNSLEVRENELKSEQSNSKNLAEKLLALEENYRKISEEKDKAELEAGDIGRKLQSTEEKLTQVASQKAKLDADVSAFINSSNDSSAQMIKLNEDLRLKEKEMDMLREQICQKTIHFERAEQELKQQIEKQKDMFKLSKEELEREKNNYKTEMEVLKNKLEVSVIALNSSEEDWKKKAEMSASHAEKKINGLGEELRQLKEKTVQDRNQQEKRIRELTNIQKDLEEKLEVAKLGSEESKKDLEKKIQEMLAEQTLFQETIEKAKTDLLLTEKNLDEKAKKDAELHESKNEKLRNELKETKESLSQVLEELDKAKEEKNKLNEEMSKLVKTKSEFEELLVHARTQNSELTVNVSAVESENKILKETLNQVREEKCNLERDTSDKMMLVTELNMQLKSLENSKKTRDAENESRVKGLEAEITKLQAVLEKTETTRSVENSENKKQIESLLEEIQKFKSESSQLMSNKEKDFENFNAVVVQTQNALTEKQRECDIKSEQIEKLEKRVQVLNDELSGVKKKSEESETWRVASEKENLELKKKLEDQAELVTSNTEFSGRLEKITMKLAEAEKREQEMIQKARLEKEALQNLMSKKEIEVQQLVQQIESLKFENADLRKEGKLTENSEKVHKNLHAEDSKAKGSTDEPDFEKGQVDFLNSVIVDMQKKNDALKARIEILEMGYSPEDVEEFNLHNINARSVAPRLFCDICDMFDLHDTEDCPTQAGEDEPPPKSSKSKAPPPQRPYCDVCEIFGHDTADCDDGETF